MKELERGEIIMDICIHSCTLAFWSVYYSTKNIRIYGICEVHANTIINEICMGMRLKKEKLNKTDINHVFS